MSITSVSALTGTQFWTAARAPVALSANCFGYLAESATLNLREEVIIW